MLNKNYLLLGAAVITLGACSANEETVDVTRPQGAHVDLTTGQIYNQYGETDVFGVAQSLSSSNVEIYSLDAPIADIRGSQIPQRNYPRSALESNSVEIYPEWQPAAPTMQQAGSTFATQRVAPLQPVYQDDGRSISAPIAQYNDINSAGEPEARIYFDSSSSQILEQDIEVITGITKNFNPNQGQVISVEGFANDVSDAGDSTERKEENLKLSMQRAYAVARALMYSGVPSNAIRTVAHGEDGPGTGEGYSSDVSSIARRVDIHIINDR